ncbi:MAG: glycosyltransferase family 2 protein [Deltaproteobacteria bacterium]|nr:glycosyltransferase family 2 protein [Deltaproteobacteria bacterium]
MIYTLLESFVFDLSNWMSQLTLTDFFLLYWPLIIIDALRSLLKNIVVLIDWALKKIRNKEYPTHYPPVTLIIPAHNEEKVIENSIQAALEATYPNKEIIVVDDGSKDKTFEIAQRYASKGLIKLVHRDHASGSKSGALNNGILFATGDIIITVDADTLLEREAITEIVKPFADSSIAAVSGNVRILRGEKGGNNILTRLQAYEYAQSIELGRRFNSLIGMLLIISGAFGAFRLKDVKSLGQYSTDTITEDFEITFKFRKLNKRLVFAEKAISWTYCPETWRDWQRQRIRWTRGQAETLWRHRNVFSISKFQPSYIAAVYDMLFMDFFLLFIRIVWFLYHALYLPKNVHFIVTLMFILYLVIEINQALTAGLLSPLKNDLKNIVLFPVMVLFYRPYYSLVRLYAYIQWAMKVKSSW